MKVSCIMPAHHPEMMERAIAIFNSQDYADKELVIVPQSFDVTSECLQQSNIIVSAVYSPSVISLGMRRNVACRLASGDVILHMDSDDYYTSDWITHSVKCLVDSGANCVGLRTAYFYQPDVKLWLYQYTGRQGYAIGATLCYWKDTWRRNPFPDIQSGEDTAFVSNAGKIFNHDYVNGFCAIIHGKNTCSHKALSIMKERPIEQVRHINGLRVGLCN